MIIIMRYYVHRGSGNGSIASDQLKPLHWRILRSETGRKNKLKQETDIARACIPNIVGNRLQDAAGFSSTTTSRGNCISDIKRIPYNTYVHVQQVCKMSFAQDLDELQEKQRLTGVKRVRVILNKGI